MKKRIIGMAKIDDVKFRVIDEIWQALETENIHPWPGLNILEENISLTWNAFRL